MIRFSNSSIYLSCQGFCFLPHTFISRFSSLYPSLVLFLYCASFVFLQATSGDSILILPASRRLVYHTSMIHSFFLSPFPLLLSFLFSLSFLLSLLYDITIIHLSHFCYLVSLLMKNQYHSFVILSHTYGTCLCAQNYCSVDGISCMQVEFLLISIKIDFLTYLL